MMPCPCLPHAKGQIWNQLQHADIADISQLHLVENRVKTVLAIVVGVVLCIGSNLGLKFGRERPIRVLLPHLAEPKIYK